MDNQLELIDAINQEIRDIYAIADILATTNTNRLNNDTIERLGKMIEKSLDRLKKIIDTIEF